jgi:hypothetical protein
MMERVGFLSTDLCSQCLVITAYIKPNANGRSFPLHCVIDCSSSLEISKAHFLEERGVLESLNVIVATYIK